MHRAETAVDARARVGRKRVEVCSWRGSLLFQVVPGVVGIQRIRIKNVVTLYRAVVFVSFRLSKKICPGNKSVGAALMLGEGGVGVFEIRIDLVLVIEGRIRQIGRPVSVALIRSTISDSRI